MYGLLQTYRHKQGQTQGHFKSSLTGFNSEFSVSLTVCRDSLAAAIEYATITSTEGKYLSNKCSVYDTKTSNGRTLVVELQGIINTSL